MVVMSNKIFRRLGRFIHEECGIKMPQSKKVMLQARLQKRLRALGINSFDEYCDLVLSPQGAKDELFHMIDLVSTNKTDFFREPSHFDYLVKSALPELTNDFPGNGRMLKIWSAGCSSGEEPYTLAMVLSKFADNNRGFHFSIFATDISVRILERAKAAIYTAEKVEPVPADLKHKYLLKSKDRDAKIVRVVPELRSLVKFQRLNFMDDDFGFRQPFDIIFCRNVIIYFDLQTQATLLNKFYQHLRPGGYLFMGHSETLHSIDVPFVQVAPTIHRKPPCRD